MSYVDDDDNIPMCSCTYAESVSTPGLEIRTICLVCQLFDARREAHRAEAKVHRILAQLRAQQNAPKEENSIK